MRVFFVISGFLITTLLVTEVERTGRIDLRHFYFRRTLRIFPPYYILIGVVAMLIGMNAISAPAVRYWPALSYTSNWFTTNSWWLGHSWSLSVEEQFYLGWPLCMMALGITRSRFAAVAMLFAAPALRCVLLLATRDGNVSDNFNFDFIAAGCALALFRPRLLRSPRWHCLARGPLAPLGAAVAIALHVAFADSYGWRFLVEMVLIQPFEAVALAVFLSWCIANPRGVTGKTLNSSPLRGIGIASYSIYLWQQVVLGAIIAPPWYARIALAIAVGGASYYLIERPALTARRWIELRRAPGRTSVLGT